MNFFFGANGAGKTTISEALRGTGGRPVEMTPAPRSASLSTRVYNRTYIEETIANAADLPGVFVLGTGSANAEAEIEALEGPHGTVSAAETNLKRLRLSLGQAAPPEGKLGEIAQATNTLSEQAWGARASFPTELRAVFSGFNASKSRLLEQVRAVAAKHATSDAVEKDLIAEAAGAFDPDAVEIAPLTTIKPFDPAAIDGHELLSTAIVGSSDVSLATLIESLGNSDWVAEGRRHLEHSHGQCPFCQQATPPNLLSDLAAYFDDRFMAQTGHVHSFAARYQSEAERIRSALVSIAAAAPAQLPAETFELAQAPLTAELAENERRLAQKLSHPGTPVELTSVTALVDAVNRILRDANELIVQHNDRVRHQKVARAELVEKCWRHFVRGALATELAAYEATMTSLESARVTLTRKITEAEAKYRAAQERLTHLRAQLRSSQQVIDEINATLTSVGFTNFTLAHSDSSTGGYTLIRNGGSPAASSLSEGERTFITFLYFYYQLRHVSTDAAEDQDLLVVIDDPISSLDSDILFVVSSLTRQIIQSAHAPAHKIRQVIVLTHNTQFHKEITYERHGEKNAATKFFVIRKTHGGHSRLEQSKTNPVTSTYRALWVEVRRFRDDPSLPAIGLENILRRIVENYFTTIGFIADSDLQAAFTMQERMVCRSLFAWMNDGSHTIIDDLHYAPSEITTATYLEVFRRLFEEASHFGHYTMMMDGVITRPTNAPLLTIAPEAEIQAEPDAPNSPDDAMEELEPPA